MSRASRGAGCGGRGLGRGVRSSFSSAGLAALAILLAGCGSSHHQLPGNHVRGDRLTVYVSLPYIGPSAPSGEAAFGGADMALQAVGGRIGRYRIALRSLDDATVARDGADPGQASANARLAVRDPTTIGYVGDLNSGATAVAIPLLSQAGIPQISPASTAVGLTEGGNEASPGEPQKYYPTGLRTFARVIPNDSVQATAQVHLQQAAGCHSTYVLDDGEVDGEDAAMSFAAAARAAHLTVVGPGQYDPRVRNYASLGQTVAASHAGCVLVSGLTQDNAVALTTQIARAVPQARLFATAGLAERAYVDPARGGLPAAVAARIRITAPVLDVASYPPAGRRFWTAYARRYGAWQPDAIYGYEAMSLMLDAISRATHHGRRAALRSAVTRAIFTTRDRRSVLGTYSITSRGDTTLTTYGVYRVQAGRLVFAGTAGA